MKTILTSSMGYFKKGKDGKRIPESLYWYNGFLEKLQRDWVKDSKVLIIAASADDYEKNDDVCECFRKAFEMSGLSVSYMENCDIRNMQLADRIREMDVVLLAGGHVPTQNEFFISPSISFLSGITLNAPLRVVISEAAALAKDRSSIRFFGSDKQTV